MPAITPSYLYTFFAIIAVSSILLISFTDYANAIRFSSEMRKLKKLVDYVAAKATELLMLAKTANASAETYIQAPTAIGDKPYWLRLENNSAGAWLEGGLGSIPLESGALYIYLPGKALASGYYISGYGAIRLRCSAEADVPRIQISGLSQNGG
jgi:hypothetical protein